MNFFNYGTIKIVKYLAFLGVFMTLLVIMPIFIMSFGNTSESFDCGFKPIHGVWYIGWERGSYANQAVDRDLRIIKRELCANYIALQANMYQKNRYSSDPHIDDRTVEDEILSKAVKKVHDLGMKVVLLTPIRSDDGTWQGSIKPAELGVWFSNWEKILVHYAKFSEKYGVEVLLLGTELPTLRDEPERWKDIIK